MNDNTYTTIFVILAIWALILIHREEERRRRNKNNRKR